LYNIIIELGISMKIVLQLIKMLFKGTYSRARKQNLCYTFPVINGLKQADAL
jgi:hypothetical protein